MKRLAQDSILYILTEDSGTGYKFWCAVASIAKITVIVKSSHGNKNIEQCFDSLPLAWGDTLYLAVDGFDTLVPDSIKYIVDVCSNNNVSLIFPNYYCFEELMLSYTKWEQVCPYTARVQNCCYDASSHPIANIKCFRCHLSLFVNVIRRIVWNNSEQLYVNRNTDKLLDYKLWQFPGYDAVIGMLCRYMNYSSDVRQLTKEKQLKHILTAYTSNMRSCCYSITSNSISECWLISCYKCMHRKIYIKYANTGHPTIPDSLKKKYTMAVGKINICRNSSMHGSLRDKLLDFSNNSVLKFSLDLNKIL